MSGTLTLEPGQIFTGGGTVGGDTGQLAFTQTGTVTFNTSTSPPTLTEVVISKDVLASSQSFNTETVESVTITAVNTLTPFILTTADIPPGVQPPSGFTLPQDEIGTVIDVSASATGGLGPLVLTGSAAILGINGPLVLVGDVQISAFGQTLNAGAAILSLGTQATGSGLSEVFTPVYTVAPCFATGTRIQTPGGEIAVEALREGQHVVTASGGSAPVVWLGRRVVDCARHPRPPEVWPVRIAAGAFGPAQPVRDLMLSPDHAVFADGALIPARHLVNGSSVTQQEVDEVTYWHVELPAHGVLLAEGLTCESYLDTGNRAAFEGRPLRFDVQSYTIRVSA